MKKTDAQVAASALNRAQVRFTEDRPSTAIGPQGDHVSAYTLLKKSFLLRLKAYPSTMPSEQSS